MALTLTQDDLDAIVAALPTVAEIADGVWDEAASGHSTVGTYGQIVTGTATLATSISSALTTLTARVGAWTGTGVNTVLGAFKAALSKSATVPSDIGGTFDPAADSTEAISEAVAAVKAQTAAIETDTQDLQTQIGTDGAGLTAIGDTRLANLDATVSSRLATAGYTAPLDAAGIRTAVGMSTNNLDTQLAALPTDADVQTAAAAALTAYDPPTKAELDSGFAGLNDPTAAAVADAVWDEAIGGHTSAGSTSKALIDVLDDTSTSLPLAIASITPQSAADIRAEMDANSTKLAAIVADTNELQTNQGNWLTADVSALATAAALATVDGIVDDILVDTGTTLPGLIAGVGAGSGTGVYTDTLESPTGVPVDGARVTLATDEDGENVAYEARTDAFGVFEMRPDPGTYYRFIEAAGHTFTQGVEVLVEEA